MEQMVLSAWKGVTSAAMHYNMMLHPTYRHILPQAISAVQQNPGVAGAVAGAVVAAATVTGVYVAKRVAGNKRKRELDADELSNSLAMVVSNTGNKRMRVTHMEQKVMLLRDLPKSEDEEVGSDMPNSPEGQKFTPPPGETMQAVTLETVEETVSIWEGSEQEQEEKELEFEDDQGDVAATQRIDDDEEESSDSSSTSSSSDCESEPDEPARGKTDEKAQLFSDSESEAYDWRPRFRVVDKQEEEGNSSSDSEVEDKKSPVSSPKGSSQQPILLSESDEDDDDEEEEEEEEEDTRNKQKIKKRKVIRDDESVSSSSSSNSSMSLQFPRLASDKVKRDFGSTRNYRSDSEESATV